jgi:hypothetical protein
MPIKLYNKTNFHNHTFCIFKEMPLESIKDLKLNYKSKSGSSYYFVAEGVYRLSNHWGRAANCKWRLDKNSTSNGLSSNRTKLGFAAWNAFYPDNDLEKLYFLEVDYDHQIVHFYHKQSENYTSDKVLRTTNDTTKLIKQIRNLLEETAWAKYLSTENIVDLRKQIINQLIHTNQTFQEIRRDFL